MSKYVIYYLSELVEDRAFRLGIFDKEEDAVKALANGQFARTFTFQGETHNVDLVKGTVFINPICE